MNYKLLVLDLDGTLTNSKKEITPFTRETLLQAQEKGLHLVLASGRPTYGIVPLAEELNIKQYGGFILSFNGGKVIDLMTAVSYTHLRAHETEADLVCRLLLEKIFF